MKATRQRAPARATPGVARARSHSGGVSVRGDGATQHRGPETGVGAAKILGMFQPPESLNSAGVERMTPSMIALRTRNPEIGSYARFEHYLTTLEVET